MTTINVAMLKFNKSNHYSILAITALIFASTAQAIGPRDRLFPNRPNPPGPNNPIGPNHPAISHPLSSLNPNTPYSNNQIVLRQLLLNNQQSVQQPTSTPPSTRLAIGNTGTYTGSQKLLSTSNVRLLLLNRMAFSTSHPIGLQQPNPMTPLTNDYVILNGKYYAIKDLANSRSAYLNDPVWTKVSDIKIYPSR